MLLHVGRCVHAVVLSGLEEVASSLEVSLSDALNLVTQQPTLLLAKVGFRCCFCRWCCF